MGHGVPACLAAIAAHAWFDELRPRWSRRPAGVRGRRQASQVCVLEQPDGRLRRRAGSRADCGRPRRPRQMSEASSSTMRTGSIAPRPQLVTYPDSLGGDLRELAAILEGPMAGLFRGVHVLPPFPASGDGGLAPVT